MQREGFSTYNKIYEFPYTLQGQQVQMVFTSVSGHLLNYEFVGSYKRWTSCSPLDLFDAPVTKGIKEENMQKIKVCTLQGVSYYIEFIYISFKWLVWQVPICKITVITFILEVTEIGHINRRLILFNRWLSI